MSEPTGGKNGRPPFAPTKALRRKVSIWKAGGMSDQDIADSLGISRTTLLKHCDRELTVGAKERKQELLDALYRVGKKGNVGAVRLFMSLQPIDTGAPNPEPMPADPAPAGKKQQADADAAQVAKGTGWGALLTPQPAKTVQ